MLSIADVGGEGGDVRDVVVVEENALRWEAVGRLKR
jgi:hypothetical protein